MSAWLDKCWWWHRWVFQHRDSDFNWYRCVLCGSWKKTRLLAICRGEADGIVIVRSEGMLSAYRRGEEPK